MKLFHVKFLGLKRAYSWKNVPLRDYNFWKPNIFLAMSTIIFYLIIFLVSKFHNPPPPISLSNLYLQFAQCFYGNHAQKPECMRLHFMDCRCLGVL